MGVDMIHISNKFSAEAAVDHYWDCGLGLQVLQRDGRALGQTLVDQKKSFRSKSDRWI
jgi:hypothetical protein